jgi:DNA-directed RNA polymerase subunit M/transcription elongation factor TFIIS
MAYCDQCQYLFVFKKNIKGEEGVGFFFCENCGNHRTIESGTVVYRDAVHREEKPSASDALLDIYQRKIDMCTRCKKKTELIMHRDDRFNVTYFCTSCDRE